MDGVAAEPVLPSGDRLGVLYDVPLDDLVSVVLGPCPGCLSWQVDYTHELQRWFFVRHLNFFDVVEGALQEHLDECPKLRDILEFSELEPEERRDMVTR